MVVSLTCLPPPPPLSQEDGSYYDAAFVWSSDVLTDARGGIERVQEIEDAARDMQNLAQHFAHVEQGLASETAKSFLQDVHREGGDKVSSWLR
jgi:hypothetical protein